MRQGFASSHKVDRQGFPAGGYSDTIGSTIRWQDGPLGRGDEKQAANGSFVEDIITIVIDRIQFYERASDGRFSCRENQSAIKYLRYALEALDSRTKRREAEGVEGTHQRGKEDGFDE